MGHDQKYGTKSKFDGTKCGILNLQKEDSTVGSLEEPKHQTPTYDSIYGRSNGRGPKEYI